MEDLGSQTVKNIAEPVRVYRVKIDGETGPTVGAARRGRPSSPRRLRPAHQIIAGLVLLAVVGQRRYWSSPIPSTQRLSALRDSALRTDARQRRSAARQTLPHRAALCQHE